MLVTNRCTQQNMIILDIIWNIYSERFKKCCSACRHIDPCEGHGSWCPWCQPDAETQWWATSLFLRWMVFVRSSGPWSCHVLIVLVDCRRTLPTYQLYQSWLGQETRNSPHVLQRPLPAYMTSWLDDCNALYHRISQSSHIDLSNWSKTLLLSC